MDKRVNKAMPFERVYFAVKQNDGIGGQTVFFRNVPGGQIMTLLVEPSQKIVNHSPDGFNWGYAGSGPAQLALAILLNVTSDPITASEYSAEFKNDYVQNWGRKFSVTRSEILDWLNAKKGELCRK